MWFRDVIEEAEKQGHHTVVVQIGHRYGMTLFIASEVMFFVAWFWAFYNASLFPTEAIGNVWPPADIKTFDPWDIPLINTLILLLSGTTVTWAHHAMLENDRKGLVNGLIATVFFLALYLLAFKRMNIINVYNFTKYLWFYFLYGYRLSRFPCYSGYDLLSSMSI